VIGERSIAAKLAASQHAASNSVKLIAAINRRGLEGWPIVVGKISTASVEPAPANLGKTGSER
jgi:hypothetical protein